jgi:beta-lactam-binding protein with PASTA domain
VFTSDTGIRVQVHAAISGGFSISIDEPGQATVPDLFEMSGANAAKAVHAAGLVAKFAGANSGNAWVASQSPVAGSVVALGSTVTMVLRTGPIP